MYFTNGFRVVKACNDLCPDDIEMGLARRHDKSNNRSEMTHAGVDAKERMLGIQVGFIDMGLRNQCVYVKLD